LLSFSSTRMKGVEYGEPTTLAKAELALVAVALNIKSFFDIAFAPDDMRECIVPDYLK
jgi:hypothetical protein